MVDGERANRPRLGSATAIGQRAKATTSHRATPQEDTRLRVFQLNTYPRSHRDQPNGPSSRPWKECFFNWETLSKPVLLM